MTNNYTYQGALEASQRVNWRIEDIIGGEKRLDFNKPLMPESLAQVQGLSFLSPEEKRTLNQIRGHEYLAMFGLVEEFILPYVVDHVRHQLSQDLQGSFRQTESVASTRAFAIVTVAIAAPQELRAVARNKSLIELRVASDCIQARPGRQVSIQVGVVP